MTFFTRLELEYDARAGGSARRALRWLASSVSILAAWGIGWLIGALVSTTAALP
jgi:hypothetical protein